MLIPIEKVSVRFPDLVSSFFVEFCKTVLEYSKQEQVRPIECYPGTFEAKPIGTNAEYLIAAKELGWKEIEIIN